MNKTCAFYTLGCKVNQYETQMMREQLAVCGLKETSCKDDSCDVFVINTCTVTRKADRESRTAIKRALKQNPNATIVAAGCYAEAEREKVMEILGDRGILVGNKDKLNICSLLGKTTRYSAYNIQHETRECISDFAGRTRAFVKLQDGCNNQCSYCKIPYVRGPSRSRTLEDIVYEVENLVGNGFKEVVLTGVCIGSYRDNSHSLASVVERIDSLDGLLRIRLSSIEPDDITCRLLTTISRSKKVCHHLHIPFQSADDKILKRMNRNYTRSYYLDIANKVITYLPKASISTDIIVGFPGEDEDAFENTVDFLKRIKPIKVHIFPFSPRRSTPAYCYNDRIPHKITVQRISRLRDILKSITLQHLSQLAGASVKVLIEAQNTKGFFSGYTDTYLKVAISASCGPSIINTLKSVRVVGARDDYLLGEIT